MNSPVQNAWREFCHCPGEDAFSNFYERTGGSVYSICRRILRDPEEARDALQSVYCELLARAHRRGASAATEDIDEVVRTLAAREAERRRKQRWRRRQHTSEAYVLDSIEASNQAPDEAVAAREVRSRVSQFVSELSDQYRIPLVLNYFHDMTHDQISEALDIPRRTISRRIAEGLELLEARMRKAGLADAITSLALLLGAARLLQVPASLSAKSVYATASAKLLAGAAGASATGSAGGYLALGSAMKVKVAAGIAVVVLTVVLGIVFSRRAMHPVSPAVAVSPVASVTDSAGASAASRTRPERPARVAPTAAVPATPRTELVGVSGRVVSLYDKQPLANVTVRLLPRRVQPTGNDEAPVATSLTGPDGRFMFPPAPEGRYSVAFRPSEPWVPVTREAVLQFGIGTEMGDVALNRRGTIRGRVVHVPDDKGIPDVEVALDDLVSTRTNKVKTGAKGEFEFTGLTEPVYMLRADRNILLNYYGVRVRLASGDTAQVDIPFGSTTLRGHLLRGGKPAIGAALTLTAEGTEIMRTAAPDANGVYEAPDMPPGRWHIRAIWNVARLEMTALEDTVTVADTGVTTKDLELPSGRLVGRVVDQDDRPVSGSLVVALTSRSAAGDGELVPVTSEQVSGPDGSFVFEDILPGSHRVFSAQADKSAASAKAVDIPFSGDSKPVVIKMSNRPGGHLLSVVLDDANGTPIRDAWCYLTGPAGTFDHGRVRDAKGMLEVRDIPPGSYDVEVSSWGYSRARHTVTITPGETVTLNDVLHEAGAFRWGIQAPDGSAVPGVRCKLIPVDSSSIEQSREGRTGPDGRWTVRGIIPGEYTATASVAGGALAESITIHAHDLTEKSSVCNGQAATDTP
jgi:RNA polymerase sigma factor (sigma-70 family)